MRGWVGRGGVRHRDTDMDVNVLLDRGDRYTHVGLQDPQHRSFVTDKGREMKDMPRVGGGLVYLDTQRTEDVDVDRNSRGQERDRGQDRCNQTVS